MTYMHSSNVRIIAIFMFIYKFYKMAYTVNVLFDGFSRMSENGKEMYANCTCTIITGPKNIIVDTMTAWDGEKILSALKKHKLDPENIDWVVCSHGHSDHIGNNALFLNAVHCVGQCISKKETYFINDFDKGTEYRIDDKIKIIPTPGHTLSDVSVIVETEVGIVAIVGDLFERAEDIEDENIWLQAGSENPELQRENRKRIVEKSDFIIPGHGPMFKVTDKIRNTFL